LRLKSFHSVAYSLHDKYDIALDLKEDAICINCVKTKSKHNSKTDDQQHWYSTVPFSSLFSRLQVAL